MPTTQVAATAFIVVSQSETLARGVCEVVTAMAPNVAIVACGCHDEGLDTATSLVKQSISALMDRLDADSSIVLMADLGAARLAVQKTVTDLANRSVVMGRGPLVEGCAAGVVAAQQGESLGSVLRSIASAAQFFPDPDEQDLSDTLHSQVEPVNPLAPRTLIVTDPAGLGPKPAAVLARKASEFKAAITVNGVNATSVLALMGLHATQGSQIELAATGPEATIALERLAQFLQGQSEAGSLQAAAHSVVQAVPLQSGAAPLTTVGFAPGAEPSLDTSPGLESSPATPPAPATNPVGTLARKTTEPTDDDATESVSSQESAGPATETDRVDLSHE